MTKKKTSKGSVGLKEKPVDEVRLRMVELFEDSYSPSSDKSEYLAGYTDGALDVYNKFRKEFLVEYYGKIPS